MPGIHTHAWVAVMLLAAAWPTVRGDDDVPAAAGAAERAEPQRQADIDLAAHVDINVVLPPNHWRISGGAGQLVVLGGGRLQIDGHLTIGGEAMPPADERIRRADEAVRVRLRQAQRDRLAVVAAHAAFPADRRRALELATEADVNRVLTDVARLRNRYAGTRARLGDEVWQEFLGDVQACRRSIADPFGEGSLFSAVWAGFAAEADGP